MKKFLTGSLTVMTIVWAMGLSAFVAVPASAAVGDLVKSASSSTVYVVKADGVTICQFPHANVYKSWGYPSNFSTVMTKDLSSYTVGSNIEFRDASLVKGDGPAVYLVYNNMKRPIISDVVFLGLGYDWDKITWLSDAFLADYTTGAVVDSSTMHPDGQIVKYAGSPAVYLIDNGMKRPFASGAAFEANRYSWGDIITIPDTETYPNGSGISGYEQALSLPNCIGSVSQGPVGTGLNVSSDSSNPVSSTVISESSTHAQTLIPFVSVRFTASSDGSVKVKNLKFKRTGISADSDVVNTYLFDGINRVAIGGSLSGGVVTFNDPNGLFEVPAGSSKVITLRGDLKVDVGAGKTIGFDLLASSDITTDGASVNGGFPVKGNLMNTASVDDLGYVTIAGSYTSPASDDTSINPDTNVQVWSFSLQADGQNVMVKRLKFTKVGSVQQNDLKNFMLYSGGTLVGQVTSMNSDFEVIFDLSGSPLEITKGSTRNMSLRADIIGGSSRDFKFTFQYADDLMIMDSGYNVYVPAILTGGSYSSWSVVQPTGDYKVAAGSVSVSKASNSPVGNVSKDATNQLLGKFEFKATGEDVRVNNLKVSADTTGANGIDNGKVFLDGVQVGSTSDLLESPSATTTFTFGSSFILKAGQTHVVDIYGDVKDKDGVSFNDGNSVQVLLAINSSNAQGLSSLNSLSIPATAQLANSLNVKEGTLSVNNYSGYGTQTLARGTKKAKIGEFVISAGSAEGVDVDSVSVVLDSTEKGDIENLYLMDGVNQLGTLRVTPTETNLFTVSLSLNANQSKVIGIYADIKNTTTGSSINAAVSATGVGKSTSGYFNASQQTLQTINFGTGSLTFAADPVRPDSDIVLAGTSNQLFNAVEFTAENDDFEIQELTVTTTGATSNNFGTVYLDYPTKTGTGQASGILVNGYVVFTGLNMFVERDNSATLKISADLPLITSGATSGAEVKLNVDASGQFRAIALSSGEVDADADDASGSVKSQSDVESNKMVVRKTRPTVSLSSLTSTSLVNGTREISRFTISADAKGPVSLYEFTWEYSTSGAAIVLADAVLYDVTGGAKVALTPSTTPTYTGNKVVYNLATKQDISASASKTYSLEVTISGSDGSTGGNDTLLVRLGSPYTTTQTGNAIAVAANETSITWSDRSSTGSHTFLSADWANAQYVKTLPSAYQQLSTN